MFESDYYRYMFLLTSPAPATSPPPSTTSPTPSTTSHTAQVLQKGNAASKVDVTGEFEGRVVPPRL